MSRVLARSMFKKNAPKKSARGVGITSMLEDDVPAYAKGGEVESEDRLERERIARELLLQNKHENADLQTFSEGDRPQMFRQPATMPVAPQPNPQQIQAMQMQQMAQAQQMGLVPRFAEGGPVEVPSMWSNIRQGIGNAIGMRGREPLFARGSGDAIPTRNPLMGSPAADNPDFRYNPPPVISPDATNTDPMGGYTGGALPPPPTPDQSFGIPGAIPRAALGLPVFKPAEKGAPSEEDQAKMEADREARKAKAFSNLPDETGDDEEGGAGTGAKTAPASSSKPSDLTDIKRERAAKESAAKNENFWLAVMQAGLAVMGGKSSNALTNIGQGGQAGLASFMALEQQRRRDEDAAMRRDIAERELQLQTRRMNAQEPLLAAQAQYYRDRPGMEAAKLSMAEKKMLFLAKSRAEDQVYAEAAKNPLAYADKKGNRDEMKIQLEIRKRTQKNFLEDQIRGSSNPNGLGLELPDTSSGE